MNLHIKDKEIQNLINNIGYEGCKNCQHQIAPLRKCYWSEQGGDGIVHLICPKWDKRDTKE